MNWKLVNFNLTSIKVCSTQRHLSSPQLTRYQNWQALPCWLSTASKDSSKPNLSNHMRMRSHLWILNQVAHREWTAMGLTLAPKMASQMLQLQTMVVTPRCWCLRNRQPQWIPLSPFQDTHLVCSIMVPTAPSQPRWVDHKTIIWLEKAPWYSNNQASTTLWLGILVLSIAIRLTIWKCKSLMG